MPPRHVVPTTELGPHHPDPPQHQPSSPAHCRAPTAPTTLLP